MKLEELEDVLSFEFPEEAKPPKSFLEIARVPHYENVISNILAFFFDPSEEHGLQDLFLSALLSLIKVSKNWDANFLNCNIEREVISKNGRIDILLQDLDANKSIIIENKIYHHLNNDLNDYFDSVEGSDGDTFGVVLSLYHLNVIHPHFINITHQEFCDVILSKLGRYYPQASDKYLFLLKDYLHNINSFYPSEGMQKKINFYFQYQDKITDLAKLKDEVINYAFDEINKAGSKLNYQIGAIRSKIFRYWIFEGSANLYYTIFIEDLVNGYKPSIQLVLELYDISDEKWTCLQKASLNEKYQSLDFAKSKPATSWIHFAKKSYVLTPDQFLNLADFLCQKASDDFEEVKGDILKILS